VCHKTGLVVYCSRIKTKIELQLFHFLLLICLFPFLFTCNRIPKDIESNLAKYDKLVELIQKNYKVGEVIDESKCSNEIKELFDTLKITSVSYHSADTTIDSYGENIIRFCGDGSIFSGDSCFTYNWGTTELEIRNKCNSGCERVKLFGKWYKDFIYFD
jgi:hypothetical protein